jgi:hypothetical protein
MLIALLPSPSLAGYISEVVLPGSPAAPELVELGGLDPDATQQVHLAITQAGSANTLVPVGEVLQVVEFDVAGPLAVAAEDNTGHAWGEYPLNGAKKVEKLHLGDGARRPAFAGRSLLLLANAGDLDEDSEHLDRYLDTTDGQAARLLDAVTFGPPSDIDPTVSQFAFLGDDGKQASAEAVLHISAGEGLFRRTDASHEPMSQWAAGPIDADGRLDSNQRAGMRYQMNPGSLNGAGWAPSPGSLTGLVITLSWFGLVGRRQRQL